MHVSEVTHHCPVHRTVGVAGARSEPLQALHWFAWRCHRSYTTATTFSDALLRGIALYSPAAALSMLLASKAYKAGLDAEHKNGIQEHLTEERVQQVVADALGTGNPVSKVGETTKTGRSMT